MNKIDEQRYEKFIEVANALKEAKWDVDCIDFSKNTITISKYYAVVEIYLNVYEHTLNVVDKHQDHCYRYIDYVTNEDMVKTILKVVNEFRHENYKLTVFNEYGRSSNGYDVLADNYFPDEKALLRRLFHCREDEVGDDNIFSIEERETHFPNPAIKLIIKKMSKDDKEIKEITDKHWQLKDTIPFQLRHIEYNVDRSGYNTKVLDTIYQETVYYAFVTIKD